MIITVQLLLILILTILLNSNNPIKSRFLILLATSLIFLTIKLRISDTWYPIIFFLLFTGGILIIFIILSSVLPNEKTKKIKIRKLFIITIIIVVILNYRKKINIARNLKEIKRFLNSRINFIFILALILIYFFYSINLNTTEEYSIRSFQCYS